MPTDEVDDDVTHRFSFISELVSEEIRRDEATNSSFSSTLTELFERLAS